MRSACIMKVSSRRQYEMAPHVKIWLNPLIRDKGSVHEYAMNQRVQVGLPYGIYGALVPVSGPKGLGCRKPPRQMNPLWRHTEKKLLGWTRRECKRQEEGSREIKHGDEKDHGQMNKKWVGLDNKEPSWQTVIFNYFAIHTEHRCKMNNSYA